MFILLLTKSIQDIGKMFLSLQVSTKNLELIVNNLKPNTNYIFKVVSVNENGTSAPTPEVHILTKAFGQWLCQSGIKEQKYLCNASCMWSRTLNSLHEV